ncbi:MAG: hypothetical protein KGH74_03500 [Candidatus Micrarchaeota archaeon]|nr:hypothetical protein [Candidatus Micrarchaeota archaeon]
MIRKLIRLAFLIPLVVYALSLPAYLMLNAPGGTWCYENPNVTGGAVYTCIPHSFNLQIDSLLPLELLGLSICAAVVLLEPLLPQKQKGATA